MALPIRIICPHGAGERERGAVSSAASPRLIAGESQSSNENAAVPHCKPVFAASRVVSGTQTDASTLGTCSLYSGNQGSVCLVNSTSPFSSHRARVCSGTALLESVVPPLPTLSCPGTGDSSSYTPRPSSGYSGPAAPPCEAAPAQDHRTWDLVSLESHPQLLGMA